MARSIPAVSAFSLAIGLAFSGIVVGPSDVIGMAGRLGGGRIQQGGRGAAPAPPAGADIREGTSEDDTISGGTGDDWLFGRNGSDFLRGMGGRDRLDAGDGDDTLDGGPDADILDGGAGADTLRGGDGDDTLDGGDDDDLLDGGGGVDDIDGGDGNDVLRGGPGNDVLAGGDENDSLNGGAGNDRLSGQDAADTLAGGAGDDVLLGGDGDDYLAGDAGDDRLDGGNNADVLNGGAGDDMLLGSHGNDTLHGLEGHDTLIGGNNDDLLNGGLGHDWILGGAGLDICLGEGGDDIFILRAGDVPPGEIETITGGPGVDLLILNGFPAVTPSASSAGGAQPAEWLLVDPLTGGTYRIAGVERVEYTQVHAQIDDKSNRPVSILLVNPSSSSTTGRVIFFGPDGSIVPAAGDDQLPFTVPALGSVRVEATVQGPVTAQVFAAAPLGVLVRGGVAADGAPAAGEAPLVDRAIVPVVENRASGIATGVLVANSAAQSTIKLTLNSPEGVELDGNLFVGSKVLEIPAYGHRMLFVRDLFPAAADFQGTMTIDGGIDRPQEGGPISVVAVERGSAGRLALSPSVPMIADHRAEPRHIVRLTAGGDVVSSIMLVNPSPNRRATGTIRFFDEGGRPWAVAINRQAPVATLPYDVPPMGVRVFATGSGGAAQTGSSRIEPAEGAIGATLRVISGPGEIAHIPSAAASSSFIAPASAQRSSGLTTLISLTSTGPAAVVQLRLRSAAGAEVSGGTAEVRLPANGHTSRTLEQLFPSAALETFEGTITVRAEGGSVAASVIQTAGGSAQGLVLPVTAIR